MLDYPAEAYGLDSDDKQRLPFNLTAGVETTTPHH
jgi:hypothetical protein